MTDTPLSLQEEIEALADGVYYGTHAPTSAELRALAARVGEMEQRAAFRCIHSSVVIDSAGRRCATCGEPRP